MNLLREQLLKAGLAPPAPPEPVRKSSPPAGRRDEPARKPGSPPVARPGQHTRPAAPRPSPKPVAPAVPAAPGELSLSQAFAERQRLEQSERDRQRHAAEAQAREKKAQRQQLKQLLAANSPLNDAAAEIARNFLWARKIRRVYVTPEQLRAVNSGELGVVALDGRFLLFPAAVVQAAVAIDPHALGLLVDPNAPVAEPDYDDPKYQVPDDLVW